MIRTKPSTRKPQQRLGAELKRLDEHRARLKEAGLRYIEVKRVIDPLESFHLQLKEEVEAYERLKRGEFEELDNLRGLGHLLITSRSAQGISQREFARRLGVHETQVSRDERNEYFGITLERAAKILDALNVRLRTGVLRTPTDRRFENIESPTPPTTATSSAGALHAKGSPRIFPRRLASAVCNYLCGCPCLTGSRRADPGDRLPSRREPPCPLAGGSRASRDSSSSARPFIEPAICSFPPRRWAATLAR
jgi:transcriptional regulator with XRE-family HTH domain